MTDVDDTQGQNKHTGLNESHSFGDIPIQSPDGNPTRETVQPVKRRKRPASSRPGRRTTRRSRRTGTGSGKKRSRSSKKNPLYPLLLVPAAAVLLYFIGLPWFIPYVIQGSLTDRLSRQLNRPVTINRVRFSPLDFKLHLTDISIGADTSRRAAADPVLCTVAAIDGRIMPTALLQGKVELSNLLVTRMEANLVRYPDGGYTAFSSGNTALMPSWLQVRGLELTDSTLLLHDLPTGTTHRIEQIKMSLPAATSGQQAVPTLSAIVNDSPILIHGQRHTGGEKKTALTLQLNDLDLQQYLAYLPPLADPLTISSTKADAVLEIILRDSTSAGAGLVITGTLTATDLLLSNKTYKLTVPSLQLTMQAEPLQNLYTVKELTLQEPLFILPPAQEGDQKNLTATAASLFADAEMGISLDRLFVNNGKLQRSKQEWQQIQLRLNGLQNAKAASQTAEEQKPAAFSLSAKNNASTVNLQGSLDAKLQLTAKLILRNMAADLLRPLLASKGKLEFSRGKLSLDGTLTLALAGGAEISLTDSILQISDFSLLRRKTTLITGKKMTAVDCTARSKDQQLRCERLTFDQADFTEHSLLFLPDSGRKNKKDRLPVTADNLEIKNSTVTLIAAEQQKKKGKKKQHDGIRLEEFTLQLSSITHEKAGQTKPDNLVARAVVGKQGQLALTGFMNNNGQGTVQLTGTGIDLNRLPVFFRNWLALPVQQGRLRFKGQLKLVDYHFTGSWTVNDFIADNKKGQAIRWQQATATGVTGRLLPFTAAIEKFTLQKPVIQLTDTNPKLPAGLFSLFRQKNGVSVLPAITVARCSISSGSLTNGGADKHIFHDLTGNIAPLRPAAQATFTLTGKMGSSNFSVRGSSGMKKSQLQELTFKDFPLYRYTRLLADSLGMDGKKAVAAWQVSPKNRDSRVTVTGLAPLPESAFSLVLALLANREGSFNLPLLSSSPTPAEVVNKSIVGQLRKLGLQTVVSPMLVLEKFLPDLNLAQKVAFLPGEAVPDFMDGLDGYATLLRQRPHLKIALRGGFDDESDRQYFLDILQDAADSKRELENIRRSETMKTLLTAEQRQQAILAGEGKPVNMEKMREIQQRPDLQPMAAEEIQLSGNTLPNLAQQRVLVIRNYLINRLKIPEKSITTEKGDTGTAEVSLRLTAGW